MLLTLQRSIIQVHNMAHHQAAKNDKLCAAMIVNGHSSKDTTFKGKHTTIGTGHNKASSQVNLNYPIKETILT